MISLRQLQQQVCSQAAAIQRRRLIRLVQQEIENELVLDPPARRDGLSADAVGRIIDMYEEAKTKR